MQNLDPDTPYDVTVTAIYPDESESEDLMGTQRTSKTCNPEQPPHLLLTKKHSEKRILNLTSNNFLFSSTSFSRAKEKRHWYVFTSGIGLAIIVLNQNILTVMQAMMIKC